MPIPTLAEKLEALKPSLATAYERECADAITPGKLAIGTQRTADILDEGMDVFVRSCRSSMGVAGDSVIGLFTAAGDLVNASCGTYLHVVLPTMILKYILKYYQDNPGIEDGDLWFANDAVYGGIHNPDMMVAMPVFYEGELVAWTAALNHTTETGAIEPGGMPVSATSRFEEGMNLPPIKIGSNFRLHADIEEMFVAFGMRAPQMVTVDLKARCTTADRVRKRVVEMCEKSGKKYVTGLSRRMLDVAEQGARARISKFPDGIYRCVNFSDGVGYTPGLIRSCFMKMTKKGAEIEIDLTGTSPENPSSFNAHAQAVVAHCTNYIYEYVFHDLPISNATLAPFNYIFPENSCLNPDKRAATSNAVMACTGVMSALHNCFAKARFVTDEWRQAGASNSNCGNGVIVAGESQWGLPFADLLAYSLNTEGQGARPNADGMSSFGFPWCVFGRAPNVEMMENEVPIVIPFSEHWIDSGGHGKYRGGVGTVQLWIANTPKMYLACHADNSKLQTPQPLFGGYNPCTVPGIQIRKADMINRLSSGSLKLPSRFTAFLEKAESLGDWETEFMGRKVREFDQGDVITLAFSAGGAGYGDPLERDPQLVAEDVRRGFISASAAETVYHVAWEPTNEEVDMEATRRMRAVERQARLQRGTSLSEFMGTWTSKRPPNDIMEWYGTWPDARPERIIARP